MRKNQGKERERERVARAREREERTNASAPTGKKHRAASSLNKVGRT